jgi:hypothetical protein
MNFNIILTFTENSLLMMTFPDTSLIYECKRNTVPRALTFNYTKICPQNVVTCIWVLLILRINGCHFHESTL